jgi:hypothetical protein
MILDSIGADHIIRSKMVLFLKEMIVFVMLLLKNWEVFATVAGFWYAK